MTRFSVHHANTDELELHMENQSAQSFLQPSLLRFSTYVRALSNQHMQQPAFCIKHMISGISPLFPQRTDATACASDYAIALTIFFSFINGISAADVSMKDLTSDTVFHV